MGFSKKSSFVLTIIVCVLLVSHQVNAEWIDSWFNGASYGGYTPGSHGHSQKRGFASFGSYQLRNTQTTPDNFITAQAPSIKAGCGGIDLLGGSVQFLKDPQLLMQKAQNIISGALYIGFEMAICILNEQLCTTYRNAESVINSLNSLQINDCATSRTIATSAVDAWKWDDKAATEKWDRWAEDTGASNLKTSTDRLMNGTSANNPAIPGSQIGGHPAIIDGCSTELQNLLNTESIVATLMSAKGYTADQIYVVRGIFGDYETDATNIKYLPPCGPNVKLNPLEILSRGIGEKMTDNAFAGSCEPQTGDFTVNGTYYPNIDNWVNANLSEIAQNIRTKTALSANNNYFIEVIPAPVLLHLKNAVITGGENVAVASYAGVCESGFTFQIIGSLYGAINENLVRAKRIVSAQKTNKSDCDPSSITQIIPALQDLEKRISDFYQVASNNYRFELESFNQWALNASLTQQFQETVMSNVAKAFGSSLAARLGTNG